MATANVTQSAVNRFWSNVKNGTPNECWFWTRGTDKDFYGQAIFCGKNIRAHRLAYMLKVGDPGVLSVLHTCDNPPCCNPKHLFLGTQRDNCKDKVKKGRAQRGEQSKRSKLVGAEVLKIRYYHASGLNFSQIAKLFNVHVSTVARVCNRETWTHL